MKFDFDISKFEEPDFEKFTQDLCDGLVERVKIRTPVKTRVLQNSVQGRVADTAIELWSDVDYAPHVEYGTVNMSGFHMFRMALEDGQAIADGLKIESKTTTNAAPAAPTGKVQLSK